MVRNESKFKLCCSFALVTWSYLTFSAFWMAIVFSYAYFAFGLGEETWKCYAENDTDNNVPSASQTGSDYHNVSANFDVCTYWGFCNSVCLLGFLLLLKFLPFD